MAEQFYLEDVIKFNSIYRDSTNNEEVNSFICDTVVGATRAFYPKDMLSNNNLYILFYGNIIDAKTRQYRKDVSLENFLEDENAIQDDTTVVSYSKQDYQNFSSAVDRRRFWSPSSKFEPNRVYSIHNYHSPSKHVPSSLDKK